MTRTLCILEGTCFGLVGFLALLTTACSSAQLPAARGQALDPRAEIRREQPPPDAFAENFDPFVAYPELQGASSGEHQHHQHGDSAEAQAPSAAAKAGEAPQGDHEHTQPIAPMPGGAQ